MNRKNGSHLRVEEDAHGGRVPPLPGGLPREEGGQRAAADPHSLPAGPSSTALILEVEEGEGGAAGGELSRRRRLRSQKSASAAGAAMKSFAYPGGLRALLEQLRGRHHAYAAMHTAASRSAAVNHRNLTVAIPVISLATTIVTNVNQDLVEPRWTTLASNVALALIVGLSAINNFLGYQKRENEHRDARNAHLRAADLIDIALACDDESPEDRYDYTTVVEQSLETLDSLKKLAVGIPSWIADKYPEYEAPWLLLRPQGGSGGDPNPKKP